MLEEGIYERSQMGGEIIFQYAMFLENQLRREEALVQYQRWGLGIEGVIGGFEGVLRRYCVGCEGVLRGY